tara:strand:+ start:924 stop:1163 length:240 start_codon:yes stop_codon:yes gene_type:complete
MDELLASMRPINPEAFSGQPQEAPQQDIPQQFDANQYLIQKIMQMNQKRKQGSLGALGNVMAAMPQPNQMPAQEGAPAA